MSNYHLRDVGLSLQAKGLLSVILSLPPDWNYSIHGLALISKEGDKAIKSTLDELKEHGYLVVHRINPKQGSNRVRYEYDVYEEPLEPTKPQVAEPYPSEGVHREGVQGEGVPEGGQLNIEGLSTDYQVLSNLYVPPKKKTRKAKPFVAPTLEEVQAYVREKGYHFSVKSFFDYYEASDWHFKNGKPVKNWKQCCATWESRWDESHPNHKERVSRDYSIYDDALRR